MSPEIKALADAVERRFDAMDLHVTMGGEPTFIPEHPEGDEWNQGALGPEKLGYARRLARRLLRTEYPGAVVMQVFGKQYPGEPLPRWVVLLLQRNDGTPLWNRPDALLLDDVPGTHPDGLAGNTMQTIADELGLRECVLPCVESDSDGTLAGWVLPLDWADGKWRSDKWPYADDEPVVLAPGESPIGLRLPLADLDEGKLRRALTVEVKNGSLHVFFPPLEL
ncbi:MAG: transglutaminase family protein, partial [Myxococcota bacterium]